METKYNFAAIESKWNKRWETEPVNVYDPDKPVYYCLDMFPYPSAAGLHVGHWRGYVISDVLSRQKLLEGHYILHPMGWDAFGLPAENYAIRTGIHPVVTTAESVKTFKRQLQDLCAIYDWSREVNTSDPAYYKWTQWIFVQMFKKGLAYEKEMLLNWCPSCKVVLANEESAGGVCERCGATAEKKYLRQWMLKITAYADRLLEGLEGLNWPAKVIKMQSDWIGKSYGAEITFKLKDNPNTVTVFTTRPDTLFGATCMVLSPEHELVSGITAPDRAAEVEAYRKEAGSKSSVDRMAA
ncbi:MAG: class I tRNA ligase family protein, partial [Clostridiales bacterium]|nr:class I tRNA ligase family protein [Clostridiales bacterium]